MQQVLRLMNQPPDARLTPALAREICERTGAAAVLEGSIAPIGSEYVIGLTAKACRTGDVLDVQQAQASKKEEVLNALTRIASNFRSRAGESISTVREHETPLADATTPSLDAFKAYSAGVKATFSAGPAAGVPFFQRAVEIDPNFAIAYALLGHSYNVAAVGDPSLAAQTTTRAYALRDRASEQERFFIDFTYATEVLGNLQKARQTAGLWAQTYPRDPNPHALVSFVDQALGKYESSIQEAQRAIDLDRDHVFGYNNLAWSYTLLNRTAEAESALRSAADRKLHTPEFLIIRYYIAFLRSDKPAMDLAIAQGRENSGLEDWMAHAGSCVAAWSGQLQQARTMSRGAINLAQQTSQRDKAALYEAGAAVREAFFGNLPEARRRAMAAQEHSKSRDVEYGASFALALTGDIAEAQAMANDLEKRFPEDTSVRYTYLPVIRGLAAISRGEPAKAVELLEAAAPFDLAIPGSWAGFFGSLYPAYVRGMAYSSLHRSSEAAAEFQKIPDHPGIVFSDPVGPVARLQLARSLAASGNRAKAKTAYEAFLTLWKAADPDIPILKQAKAEYAMLP
jgi:tetratricopeptide (TPR) repeat protein